MKNFKTSNKPLTRTSVQVIVAFAIGCLLSLPVLASAGPNNTELTFGGIPDKAFNDDGSLNKALVPDYVEYTGPDGEINGYISRDDLLERPAAPANPEEAVKMTLEASVEVIPVVDRNLQHMGNDIAGMGFVPIEVFEHPTFDPQERLNRFIAGESLDRVLSIDR